VIEVVELIIRQPNRPERVIEIRRGEVRLGRAEDNEIVLSDVGVSRRHAQVVFRGDEVKYVDLGSGNGSYYRGQRVEEQVISDHDEIMIDPFVLTFRLRGPEYVSTVGESMESAVARLDVVSAPGIFRSYFPIEQRGLSIGRADEQDIVLPDPAASRQHCRIQARGSGFVLVDNNSANGVFLNGRRVTDAKLSHGDRIRIGNSEFRFADAKSPLKSFGGGVTPVPRAGRRARQSSAVPKIILAATTMLVLVAVILALILLVVVQLQQREQVTSYTIASQAPSWSVPDVPEVSSASQAFDMGRAAVENAKPDEAFAAFTRSLELRPGDPSAERFALLAAEFQMFGLLEGRMEERAAARRALEDERDELIALARGRNPQGRRAAATLKAKYRSDPKVQAELSLGRTSAQRTLDEKLDEAKKKLEDDRAAEALALYQSVAAKAQHDDTLAAARSGIRASRRVLAKETSEVWAAGVLAERAGEEDLAVQHFAELKKAYPSSPSLAARDGGPP
jgi:pSer/pThr/pTyr-binding forkhead associated (FHA) protein